VLGASEPISISDLISLGLCNALLFERGLADSEQRFRQRTHGAGGGDGRLAAAAAGGLNKFKRYSDPKRQSEPIFGYVLAGCRCGGRPEPSPPALPEVAALC
jgi:hypothetical protein